VKTDAQQVFENNEKWKTYQIGNKKVIPYMFGMHINKYDKVMTAIRRKNRAGPKSLRN
jgi:hypothetical protein